MNLDISKLQCVKRTPNGLTARCPVCAKSGDDKTGNHLSVLNDGRFNCIVGSAQDPSHNRAIRAILRGFSGETDEVVYVEPKLEVDQVYPNDVLTKLLPDHSYWRGRGMREDVLARLENGVAPHGKGVMEGRTVFPVRNLDGGIVGFAGRLVDGKSWHAKWKNAVKTSKVAYPWNVTGVDISSTKTCILVESIGDLLGCLSHDIKPVLCIFGLNLNSVIISTLIGADVKRVIISLNRDDDPRKGQAAAEKIRAKLVNFFSDVRVVVPEVHKDWGEAAEKGDDAAFDVLRREMN